MRSKLLMVAGLLVLPAAIFAADPPERPVRFPEPPAKKDQSTNKQKIEKKEKSLAGEFSSGQAVMASPTMNSEDGPVVVLPEVTTVVQLSSSDINRLVCPSEIKDVIYSKEKGLNVKITGKDAFAKFVLLKKSDGEKAYSVLPTEMFVVCGDDTFQLIAYPRRIPAQTIRLTSGKDKKIKANQELFAGLPFEKRILKAIKDVFTENIPDSFAVTKIDKKIGRFKEVEIIHRRSFDIEGEGLRVLEYEITPKEGIKQFKLNEKLFIKKDFAENPVAISLEKHILRQGDMSRLFIVEQRPEKISTIKVTGGDQLPSIEQVSAPASPTKAGGEGASVPPVPQKMEAGGKK